MSFFLSLMVFLAASVTPPASSAEEADKTTILVAYYSETGNTESLAKAIVEGVSSVPSTEPVLRSVSEVKDEDIRTANGILVGTPVQWGGLSARAKDFVDRVGRVLGEGEGQYGEGRTAGAFCTGGQVASGKELARMAILAAFLNMRFVVVGGLQADGFGNLGAEATTGPADPGLSEKELDEARLAGERFARITREVRKARRWPLAQH